jgi:signal transduction histidine kinase
MKENTASGDNGDSGGKSAVHATVHGAAPKTKWPKLNYRWQDSWIIRAALIASFILFCGYASSALIGVQSIDAVARLAFDQDVENALGDHLNGIKKIRDLQQALIVERLRPLVKSWLTESRPELTDRDFARWIKKSRIDEIIAMPEMSAFRLVQLRPTPSAEDLAAPIVWLDRNRLKIGHYVFEYPKDKIYETFKSAEDIRQRYQLIGAKLDENIRPTLIRANLLILVVSFLVLVSLFILYAQKFKRRISEVIEGFSTWSEVDETFRFAPELYTGELKPITHQFNAMADEVEANRQRSLYLEKIASWQIIARKLAHEIKNPLTPIQMMVSQLKRRYKGDDEAFASLLDHAQTIITEEVSGLRRMVDNFSNFARLPSPEPRPCNLLSLGQHVVELQKVVFSDHDLQFKCDLKVASASIDDDLIRQVLLNLIKNAGEACGESGTKITLSLEENKSDFIFRVTDNGPGIPKELQARIFEAYFTTKHTGPTPGMGLGLAVCQKIVMDHGGSMTVQSRQSDAGPGETIFTIKLPKSPRT